MIMRFRRLARPNYYAVQDNLLFEIGLTRILGDFMDDRYGDIRSDPSVENIREVHISFANRSAYSVAVSRDRR